MDAKRDQNHATVQLGVSSADSSTPLPLRVDAVTDYLLIDIAVNSGSSSTTRSIAERDQNSVPVLMGVTNDASLTPMALSIDHTNTRLFVDITIV